MASVALQFSPANRSALAASCGRPRVLVGLPFVRNVEVNVLHNLDVIASGRTAMSSSLMWDMELLQNL